MPKMYAYNTSATQIKKRYAMIGSTATQVKKRYAMIGSTATLVYNAETPLYTYGVQNVVWKGAGDGGTSGSTNFGDSSVTIKAKGSYSNTGRAQTMRTDEKIDLTNYSKIKAIVSGYSTDSGKLTDGSSGYFRMGIADSKVINIKSYGVASVNINPTEKTDDIREVELDISAYNDAYYINISIMAYRMYDYENIGYVYSVWLE